MKMKNYNPYDNPADREREEGGMLSKYEIFEAAKKAQLDSCEKEVREIFEGIDKMFPTSEHQRYLHYSNKSEMSGRWRCHSYCVKCKLKALKQKVLGEV